MSDQNLSKFINIEQFLDFYNRYYGEFTPENSDQNLSEFINIEQFLDFYNHYYGKFTPENLVFNANLQQLGQKISDWCCLETDGKITPEEAYEKIRRLCKQNL